MNKSSIEKLKTVAATSGVITIFAVIATTILSYIEVLIFSHGDIGIANFVLNEVGASFFWGGALLSLLSSCMVTCSGWIVCWFLLTIRETKTMDINANPYFIIKVVGSMAGLAFAVTLYSYCLSIWLMILSITFGVWEFIQIIKNKQKKIYWKAVAMSIITIVILMLPTLTTTAEVLLQTEAIEMTDGGQKIVQSIAEKDDFIVIKDKETGFIEKLSKKDISEYALCKDTDSSDGFWLFRPFSELLGAKQTRAIYCNEITKDN